jgi:hypothetical protein
VILLLNKFVDQTLKALNKISSGDFGSSWMKNMVDMKQSFNLHNASDNPDPKKADGATGNDAWLDYSNMPEINTTEG